MLASVTPDAPPSMSVTAERSQLILLNRESTPWEKKQKKQKKGLIILIQTFKHSPFQLTAVCVLIVCALICPLRHQLKTSARITELQGCLHNDDDDKGCENYNSIILNYNINSIAQACFIFLLSTLMTSSNLQLVDNASHLLQIQIRFHQCTLHFLIDLRRDLIVIYNIARIFT